ncbi:MAG: hypothetical protein WA364_19280 [Candidatus Nitrosopolaris sp.]
MYEEAHNIIRPGSFSKFLRFYLVANPPPISAIKHLKISFSNHGDPLFNLVVQFNTVVPVITRQTGGGCFGGSAPQLPILLTNDH